MIGVPCPRYLSNLEWLGKDPICLCPTLPKVIGSVRASHSLSQGWEPLRKLESSEVFCILQLKPKVLSLLIPIRLYFMPVAVGSLSRLQGAVLLPPVGQLVGGPFWAFSVQKLYVQNFHNSHSTCSCSWILVRISMGLGSLSIGLPLIFKRIS